MSWLDLSRTKNELFRLDQNISVLLTIPTTLLAQGGKLYLEDDEITPRRELKIREWKKSKPIWTSHYDQFYPFTPRRNGSYKFQIKNEKSDILLSGYLSSGFLNIWSNFGALKFFVIFFLKFDTVGIFYEIVFFLILFYQWTP